MKLLFAFLFVAWQIAAFDETDLALHAERAKAAQQQGDFQKAAGEWEAIAKLRPDVPEVYSNAGMMWHFAQDYPKAIRAFRQALRLNPKLTAPHLFLGIDYYLTSFPDKALPELRVALSLEPENALARKWLAMTCFASGDFFSAAKELSVASLQNPADSELLFWLSRSHLKLLLKSYAQIKAIAPESRFLRRLRGDGTDLREGQSADALAELDGALKEHPSDPELWFRLGSTAKVLALKELNAFLERSPQSYRVFQLQAEFALADGNDDLAIERYRKAVAADPAAVQLHLGIANIQMSRHQYSKAIPEYESELHADAYSLIALERIGEAYAELKDPTKAEAYLKRALAIDPHAFDAHRLLGKVSYERGDFEAAVKHYLEAISNTTKPPASLLFQLSKAYRKLGNNVEADRWLARFQHQLGREHEDVQHRFEQATEP
jgi:tetratricopeptide (TPR) repeat protein